MRQTQPLTVILQIDRRPKRLPDQVAAALGTDATRQNGKLTENALAEDFDGKVRVE